MSTVEAVEPTSNRRGIAITDLDAGEQNVRVRNANKQTSRGKYIDGVVKGKNLPEAQGKTFVDKVGKEKITAVVASLGSTMKQRDGFKKLIDLVGEDITAPDITSLASKEK